MSTIRTAIELQDNFTGIFYQVIQSVNLGLSAMEDLHQAMNAPFDTASLFGARDSIDQATAAVRQLDEAMQGVHAAPQPVPPAPVDIPTPAPITWQTDGLEVFTNSGAERFAQEVQSANAMLQRLNQTQMAVARTAVQTDLLPESALVDLNRMQARLSAVQQRIRQIEGNPLNVGSAAANAELERLRGQLHQAVQQQDQLNQAMGNMDVTAANEAYLRLSQTVGNTERYIRDNVDEQGRFNREIQAGAGDANRLMSALKGMAAAYLSFQTVKQVIGLSDTMTQTTARLNLIVDPGNSAEEAAQNLEDLQNKLYASAQRARGSYLSTADAVSKLGTQAAQAFRSNEELIAFTELLNKEFTIAGTSAQGVDAVMLQLTQSMASGKLQGEELNSVLDNAAPMVQNIQRYLEEVQNVDASNIKDLASDGVLTAEVVKDAMFYAADEINEKFNDMPMTFGQVWQSFENTALFAFRPVLQQLNNLANSNAFQAMVTRGIQAVSVLANVTLKVFGLLANAGQAVAENWSWLSPLIWGVVGALIAYNAVQGIAWLTTLKTVAAQGAHAIASAAETVALIAMTIAQDGLNAALHACPITWIVTGIMILIAVFYAAVAAVNQFAGTSTSATGMIAGAFTTLGAFLINTFLIPFLNRFTMLANFIGNVFNDPIAAVEVAFFDLCLDVMGYITNLAHGIEDLLNKIPGVEISITSGLDSFYSKLENIQKQVKDESGWVEYVERIDFIDYSNAASAGYNFGKGLEDKVSNLFHFDAGDIGDGFDFGSALDGIYNNTADTAANTAATADSLDISEEDLTYLRDLAEREAINRFTTAEIKVDMTGMTNKIESDMDIDGIFDRFQEQFAEKLDISAEGVHR